MVQECSRFRRDAEASTPSLRAQRSNPESLRGKTLDCFAALAMTWREQRAPHSGAAPTGGPPGGRCRKVSEA
ncbi:hypothetical protein B5V03_08800 [Bradyrhizobium betae]|uniref:Uncharacterized protein n=1 Tax=Bradyrhizobium betae TaxID=244734 RepID=A0A4Q1VE52_9BRAD|nr:hypothetical protein B5V03_08800 [Bradyrhizobium betae]